MSNINAPGASTQFANTWATTQTFNDPGTAQAIQLVGTNAGITFGTAGPILRNSTIGLFASDGLTVNTYLGVGIAADLFLSRNGTGVARFGTTNANTSASLNLSGLNSLAAVSAFSGTALTTGGVAGTGFNFSSVTNFGVFCGKGAPTLSAGKGSLYLRSDGSTINDRAYINSDNSTAWVALTTAG